MALLLFRFGILFTFGLFVLNGSDSSFIKQKGSDPRLKFLLEPPPTGIVSKNAPLVLPCLANVTNVLIYDHDDGLNGDDDDDEDDDIDDDEDDELLNERDDTNRLKAQQNFASPSKTSSTNGNAYNNNRKFGTTTPHHETPETDNYYDDEEDDDFEPALPSKRVRRSFKHAKRKVRHPSDMIQYTWYRNGENISEIQINGFRVFANGTLRISNTENATGIYRCMAMDIQSRAGAILSKQCIVSTAAFQRENTSLTNITAVIGYPVVVNCPLLSTPQANFTWFHNKNLLKFDGSPEKYRNRYFQLNNGSLLIVTTKPEDNGKFKCVAENNYLPKSQRNSVITVDVVPFDMEKHQQTTGLMPPLQNTKQLVAEGGHLTLYCVGFSETVHWTFVPRPGNRPKELPNVTVELKLENVTMIHDDGIYMCHCGNITQTYDVVIMVRPYFQQTFTSINAPSMVELVLNCSAGGNPPPLITWYRNGLPIADNYKINYETPILKINAVDADDHGIYQCFARNVAGESYTSGQISIRPSKDVLLPKFKSIKCYPINYAIVHVKFESDQRYKFITFYMALKNPFEFNSNSVADFQNSSFNITRTRYNLRPFALYLRGYTSKNSVTIEDGRHKEYLNHTPLSKPIICASQGLLINSMILQNRLLLWWSHNAPLKNITLQIWSNDSLNPYNFSDHIIGTETQIYEYLPPNEIESNFIKIPVNINQLNNGTITELKFSGSVTGIVFPNPSRIVVRAIGSIFDAINGEPLEQDLRYLEWNTFDGSIRTDHMSLNFKAINIESRGVTIVWNSLAFSDRKQCLKLCFHNDEPIILPGRDIKSLECATINENTFQKTLTGLSPFSMYKFQLKSCDLKEALSEMIKVKTKIDVPGPVTNHTISKTDGITLNWGPPINSNGKLFHYLIEWYKDGENMSRNLTVSDLSDYSFKFPNVTSTDRINITIRAIGTAGAGIPIYVNLSNLNEYETKPQISHIDPTLGIAIGTILSFFCIVCCICFIVRDRTCKKHGHSVQNRSLPSNPIGGNATACNTDVHEMQTLISKADTTIILPNGDASCGGGGGGHNNQNDKRPVNNISHMVEERPRRADVLRPSNIINEQNDGGFLEDIPPAPDDRCQPQRVVVPNGVVVFPTVMATTQTNGVTATTATTTHQPTETYSPRPNGNTIPVVIPNGSLKGHQPLPYAAHSISTNNNPANIKTNGNLRITENPTQYLKNKNSSFSSETNNSSSNNSGMTNTSDPLDDSHQMLLDKNFDKITHIDDDDDVVNGTAVDDEDDDSVDLDVTDLNGSNLSARPLQQSWNFRRPIVGPNG